MIPLPTISLTRAQQVVNLDISLDVYDRVILYNQSQDILDINAGNKFLRLQATSADIMPIESRSFVIIPTLASTFNAANQFLQIQAVRKGEEPTETFPQSLIPVLGNLVDVSDRLARVLGHVIVDSFGVGTDVTDRAARLLGVINSITNAVDISDRAARLLGHVAVDSFGVGVDVTDRAARLLGVIASITAAEDTSDRAARLLGHVTPDGLLGQALMASSIPVTIASNQKDTGTWTPVLVTTALNGFAILSANANRRGIVVNRDPGTASTVGISFTNRVVSIPGGGYWECPKPVPTVAMTGFGDAGVNGNLTAWELT